MDKCADHLANDDTAYNAAIASIYKVASYL